MNTKKIIIYSFKFVIIFIAAFLLIKYIDTSFVKKILNFFNSGIGIALIGIIGVIVGSVITYIFNKNYQNKMIKNSILEKNLEELLNLSIVALKQSANLYPKRNYISNNIYFFKEKTKHTVNDKIQLEVSFNEYGKTYREFEEKLVNILLHLETHQIILNKFINYHQRIMLLNYELVTLTNDIKKLYNDKIYISLHKINLSAKYVKAIENMENKSFLILEELQFHLQNLTSDIQNISYSKMFNGIKVEKDESDKYNQISLNKNKKKVINFSKFKND